MLGPVEAVATEQTKSLGKDGANIRMGKYCNGGSSGAKHEVQAICKAWEEVLGQGDRKKRFLVMASIQTG